MISLKHSDSSPFHLGIDRGGVKFGFGIWASSTQLFDLNTSAGLALGTSYAGVAEAPNDGAIIEGPLGVGTNNPVTKIHSVGSAPYFNVVGAATADHALVIGDGQRTEWRTFPGTTSAAIQIENSSNAFLMTAIKSPPGTEGTELEVTNEFAIYTNATLGSTRGTLAAIFDASQNLLIPTGKMIVGGNTPTARLEVFGTGDILRVHGNNDDATLIIDAHSNDFNSVIEFQRASASTGSDKIEFNHDGTANSRLMNFYVGNANPIVSIRGDGFVSILNGPIEVDSGTSANLILDKGATNRGADILFRNTGSEQWTVGCADSDFIGNGRAFRIGTTSGNPNFVIVRETGLIGINEADSDAMLEIVSNAAAEECLHLKGAASQSADYLSITDSSDTNVIKIDSTGKILWKDGNTGIWEGATADSMAFYIQNANRFSFSLIGIQTNLTNGFFLAFETPTRINPIYTFMQDVDTGMGRAAADQLSLIAGGVEGIRINESGGTITVDINGATTISGATTIGDGGNTNFTEFETDGTIVLSGAATTFEDLNIGTVFLGRGASAPDLVTIDATSIEGPGFNGQATSEDLSGSVEIPHSYKNSSDITPHVHWMPSTSAAGDVIWNLEFFMISEVIDETVTGSTTISGSSAAGGTAWRGHRMDFPVISGAIGDQLGFRLFRDPTTSDDTYGADAVALTIGFHFKADTLGSRQILNK